MTVVNGNLILGSTILKRNSKIVTVTYNLKDCVCSSTASTIVFNSRFQATIKSLTPLAYCGVQVLMGNKDITADVYDIYTGTVNISSVKSNIIINAETLTTFEEASWYAVKCVAQSNILNNEDALYNLSWRLGDTKELYIDGAKYLVRICDLTPNRYQYVDNSERYSNMVLECVELFSVAQPRHTDYNGNYKTSNIRLYYTDTVMPRLPQDLKDILSNVNIDICYFTSATTEGINDYSQDKIFMPSSLELGGENPYSLGKVYQYYETYLNSARQKHKNGESTLVEWWTRTGGYVHNTSSGKTSGQVGVFSDINGNLWALQQQFSNSNNDKFTASTVTIEKGVPIFWAW